MIFDFAAQNASGVIDRAAKFAGGKYRQEYNKRTAQDGSGSGSARKVK